MIVYAQQHDTVDAICWRYLGMTAGVVEQVLLLNPNLADLGVFLPHGTEVKLPTVKSYQKTAKVTKLWS